VYDATNDQISILLGKQMQLQNLNEPVKVEGYNQLPSSRPVAGVFELYKGSNLTVKGNGSAYYVVHLDVEVCNTITESTTSSTSTESTTSSTSTESTTSNTSTESSTSSTTTGTLRWETVVNNNDEVPDISPIKKFNSYNPASVNVAKLVVFRGRSTGREMGPVGGIFKRNMTNPVGSNITKVTARSAPDKSESTVVPQPNNLNSSFTEFPSFPRIAINTDSIATRGQHQSVWEYSIDGADTRVGTTGIYVELNSTLYTGASLLGATGEAFANLYDVPSSSSDNTSIKFDVFPGSPAITDDNIIAFKGNFQVGDISKTGVFFRQLTPNAEYGGSDDVKSVASSDTDIPNLNDKCSIGTKFGSTAPPSAAGSTMVFVGLDNEEEPSCGGIYLASLVPNPKLTVLINLGTTDVPGLSPKELLTRLGEGLSYDGSLLAFWGSWGNETKTVRLYCPTTGEQARRDYCNNVGNFTSPNGDPNSICDDYPGTPCYQEKEVPVNQGLFVLDVVNNVLYLIARTSTDNGGEFDDFVFWNYSGAPPGVGPEDGDSDTDQEPPRFRSSSFISVSNPIGLGRAVFKARTGELNNNTNTYVNPVDGIYLKTKGFEGGWSGPSKIVVKTGDIGTKLDSEAVFPVDTPVAGQSLVVDELSIERESLRGSSLVLTVGFTGTYLDEDNEEVDVEFAGIYLTTVEALT
jgi:hypothetical protein